MPTNNGPLFDQIRTTQLTDREIRKVTRDAANEADRIIRSLEGKTGTGARVKSAQVALAKTNAEMWGAVGDATKIGIGDAFDAAATRAALFDEDLFRAAGINASYWRMSQLATARNGIGAYIARAHNKMTLSERVYRNTALSRGYVERALNNGLLLGKSAKEIAKDVVGFINPDVAGGASYAAMRLARTEINNAYHNQSKEHYEKTPWVENVRWNLSGSHPVPDECDEYAEGVFIVGGEPGVFRTQDAPQKPHPNCLCFITPVTMSTDKFIEKFQAGEFDTWINEQMGCSVA